MNSIQFFDKDKSKYIKGFAIILMLIHHLFAFNNRIEMVNYISIFNLGNQTIEYYLAVFSRICVPIYLFVSGYGMYYSYSYKNIEYKDIISRIIKLLKIYWVIMIIFLILGIIIGKREFNIIEFIENALTISSTYNSEWWFLNSYICLLLLFPIIKNLVNLINRKNITYILISLFGVSLVGGKLLSYDNLSQVLVLKLLLNIIAIQGNFIIGCIFCKLSIYDKVYHKTKNNTIMNGIIILICIILRGKSYILDFIMVPIFIYSICILIESLQLKRVFIYLGEHSTNIWLTHSFFFYYYFQNITFKPKYSIFILGWLIILSLLSSYFINFIILNIKSLIKKRTNQHELEQIIS